MAIAASTIAAMAIKAGGAILGNMRRQSDYMLAAEQYGMAVGAMEASAYIAQEELVSKAAIVNEAQLAGDIEAQVYRAQAQSQVALSAAASGVEGMCSLAVWFCT